MYHIKNITVHFLFFFWQHGVCSQQQEQRLIQSIQKLVSVTEKNLYQQNQSKETKPPQEKNNQEKKIQQQIFAKVEFWELIQIVQETKYQHHLLVCDREMVIKEQIAAFLSCISKFCHKHLVSVCSSLIYQLPPYTGRIHFCSITKSNRYQEEQWPAYRRNSSVACIQL